MATRPAKTGAGGATTYTGAVANGAITILAIDADNDFQEIYSNINNSNIATGAAIAYSKLNLANAIQASDLTSNSVITAKILDGNVTTAKLAISSTTGGASSAFTNAIGPISNTTETDLGASTTLTTRGGRVIAHGDLSVIFNPIAGLAASGRLRLKRDGSTIALWDTLVGQGAGAVTFPWSPTIFFSEVPTVAAHTYTVTWQWISNVNLSQFTTPAANSGSLWVIEFP